MVWIWSGQRSIWSEKSDHRRIRAHLSLLINGLSAIGSDRKRIRAYLSLIINRSTAIGSDQGPFRVPKFFVFFYREMLPLPRCNNKAAF